MAALAPKSVSMDAFGQRRRGKALVAVLLLGCAACSHVLSFVGGRRQVDAMKASPRTLMRVNIFEDIQNALTGAQGKIQNEDYKKEGALDGYGAKSARQADETKSRVVECNMPLGVAFEAKENGNIYVKAVSENSDAFDQGVRPGAQLVMVSATFGDDMWNTRGVGMNQLMTVINTRYGANIKLALENEDKDVLGDFFKQFNKPKVNEADEKAKQERLKTAFEDEEDKLKDKNMWSPFR